MCFPQASLLSQIDTVRDPLELCDCKISCSDSQNCDNEAKVPGLALIFPKEFLSPHTRNKSDLHLICWKTVVPEEFGENL